MSYNVYLNEPGCTHCNRAEASVWLFDCTRNVTPIVNLALSAYGDVAGTRFNDTDRICNNTNSWWRLHGWAAPDAVEVLDVAIAYLRRPYNASALRKLIPEGVKGDVGDVLSAMENLRLACRGATPRHTIYVTG